jgi:hypothetical protein
MRRSLTEPPAVEIAGKIVRETDKAIQLKVEGHKVFGTAAMWFPLSQLKEIHREFKTKGVDRLKVAAWLMEKKLEEAGQPTDNGFERDHDPDEETFDSFGTNPND